MKTVMPTIKELSKKVIAGRIEVDQADYDLITQATTHPRNWPYLSEYGQLPEDYRPSSAGVYLLHGEDGFIHLVQQGLRLWGCHIAMLPGAVDVEEFARHAMRYAATELGACCLIAGIPADCRAARLLAKRIGFTLSGSVVGALLRESGMVAMDIYQADVRCLMQ